MSDDIVDMNAMVTSAIYYAEHQLDDARQAWAAVCAIEQALALDREGVEKEIAQRGAVAAAEKAGLTVLAEHLKDMYATAVAEPPPPMALTLLPVEMIGQRETTAFVDWHEGDEPRGAVQNIRLPVYPKAQLEMAAKLRRARLGAGLGLREACTLFGVGAIEWASLESGSQNLPNEQWDYVFLTLGRFPRAPKREPIVLDLSEERPCGKLLGIVPVAHVGDCKGQHSNQCLMCLRIRNGGVLPPEVIENAYRAVREELLDFKAFGSNVCEACKAPNAALMYGYPPIDFMRGYPPMECDRCKGTFGMCSDPNGWDSPLRPSLCRKCAVDNRLCALCGKEV